MGRFAWLASWLMYFGPWWLVTAWWARLGAAWWCAPAPIVGWRFDEAEPWSWQVGLWGLELFAWLWFFVLGAVLASFLNVVAWRMPRGQSISYPRSHCPHCKTPLTFRENIPIIGWLLLGGRCRYCQAPIAARYVLVELALGVIFAGLLVVETLSGGANLPVRPPNFYRGAAWVLVDTRWDLLRMFAWHATLLSLLGTFLLIKLEGHRLPARLVAFILLLGLVAPLVWPDLHPLPLAGAGFDAMPPMTFEGEARLAPRPEWLGHVRWLWGLADTAAGALAGLLVGSGLEWAGRAAGRRSAYNAGSTLFMLAVGMFLGWQAVVSVGLLSACWRLGGAVLARCWHPWRRAPALAYDYLALLVQIPLWRRLSDLPAWPGEAQYVAAMVGWALLAWGLAYLAARLAGSDADWPPPHDAETTVPPIAPTTDAP